MLNVAARLQLPLSLFVSTDSSMATLIGLCLRVKLLRSLPPRFKIDIAIYPGTHSSEVDINRQLNDKERVAAALENKSLLAVVTKSLVNTDPRDEQFDAALASLDTAASAAEADDVDDNDFEQQIRAIAV